MAAALHHALLGLSAVALFTAGLRLAAPAAGRGLERVIAASVYAAAAAVGTAILLGLAGLGGSTVALALAAGATWLAVEAWSRRRAEPAVGLAAEAARWWGSRSAAERLALGAAVGAGAAWCAWQLRYPALGVDAVHYHLPEVVIWVHQGTPGSVEDVLPGLPVGNYPITNEVGLAWMLGIARGLPAVTVWPWLAIALLAVSGWAGLRRLRVDQPAAVLAVAAVCASPALLAWQSNGALTDPPALAWLAACAALCAASPGRPALLAPALVAAALSVGTKTTTAPMAVLVLALAFWANRRRLREVRGALALAVAAGVLVGGVWYLRNLFEHGSPFWPLIDLPWGDPVPPSVDAVDTSFLDTPGRTLDVVGDLYLERFAGGLVLIAGGLLAPLISRRREVLAASAATAVGLLLWMRAPVTGYPDPPTLPETTFSTTRYLLPVLATGAAALALAARSGRPARIVASLVLALGLALNLVQAFDLRAPLAPSPATPLTGAVAGAALALALSLVLARMRGAGRALGRVRPLAAPVTAAVLGALLAIPASGYVRRHADTMHVQSWQVTRWLDREPSSLAERDVAMTPTLVGPLAGDRLRRDLRLIPPGEDCGDVAARTAEGYVVTYHGPINLARAVDVARCLDRPPDYRDPLFTARRPGR